jgi:hypothetical protein
MVRVSQTDLRWKVAANILAEWTTDSDIPARHLRHSSGHVSLAALALDYEGLAGWRAEECHAES